MASPRPASAPAPRLRDALLVLLAVAGVLAAGLAVFGRRADAPARPDPGETLLDADLGLVGGGASARFRVRRPGDLVVSVEEPKGAEVSVALGPPRPPAPDGVDRPGPGAEWVARAGEAGRTLPLFASGQYVLRVESKATPPPASVRVVVRAAPPDR